MVRHTELSPAGSEISGADRQSETVAAINGPIALLRPKKFNDFSRVCAGVCVSGRGAPNLGRLRRQFPESAFVFATERGGPFTPDAVNRHIKRIAERAGFDFPVHAHMLRHACGFALANAGHETRAIQDWLGHRSIQHTVRYTELSPTSFRNFWR
jgi:Phage integrase family